MSRQLTAKQQLFVSEYMVDLNAAGAAVRSGYAPKRADAIGYENLRKPEISAAIQAEMDKRAQRTEVNADYVLQTIQQTVEAIKSDPDKNALAIFKGCELLGKHLKLFTDKVEHSGELGLNISKIQIEVVAPGK